MDKIFYIIFVKYILYYMRNARAIKMNTMNTRLPFPSKKIMFWVNFIVLYFS